MFYKHLYLFLNLHLKGELYRMENKSEITKSKAPQHVMNTSPSLNYDSNALSKRLGLRYLANGRKYSAGPRPHDTFL